jgi:hypothetical protein
VRVIDADPEARSSEVKVKVAAEHQPVPPDAMAGAPFRPVESTGLWAVRTSTSAAPGRGWLLLR